jgi:hypothetical protein
VVTSVRDGSRAPVEGTVGRDLSTNVSTHDVWPGSSLGAVVTVVDCDVATGADFAPLSVQPLRTSNPRANHASAEVRGTGRRLTGSGVDDVVEAGMDEQVSHAREPIPDRPL